jgi:aminoglycoside phosphotransferase (APT) family kinase protein
MAADDTRRRLASWLARQLPGASHVHLGELDRADRGHSAETLLISIDWHADGADQRRDVVVRLRPAPPGLLEPYDLKRQFDILRALEGTSVRAPRALWYEGTGTVLGREFYVMERLGGTVFERGIPDELKDDPARVRRMTEGMVEQIAAVHLVDLEATGLHAIGDGGDYLTLDLDHWEGEIRRVQGGPLPGLERLLAELRNHQPVQSPLVTLVHGDAKPGNFAFEGAEVAGVFDWEMASLGDPLADIGWAELLWTMPGSFTMAPGALDVDQFVALYEQLTGSVVHHREWYRAHQAFKMATIMLVASMLFDAGVTDDRRFGEMGFAVAPLTSRGLRELGIDGEIDPGPVTPRDERLRELQIGATR